MEHKRIDPSICNGLTLPPLCMSLYQSDNKHQLVSSFSKHFFWIQIPKLPDIDPQLQRNATAASNVMDRPPISELAG